MVLAVGDEVPASRREYIRHDARVSRLTDYFWPEFSAHGALYSTREDSVLADFRKFQI